MGLKSENRHQKRVDAVRAVQREESPKVVARVMDIPLNTLYDWLSRYRSVGWNGLRDGKKTGRPRKLSGSVMKWLYEAITLGDPRQYQFEFCLWTLQIIRKMLKKEHGIELSKSSISRLLNQMGLSAQRPVYKAYNQDPKGVKSWLTRTYPELYKDAKKNGAIIYFLDEASFRSDHHSGTTWGKVGETPIVEEHRGRFGINCISAITAKGSLRFRCFEGRMNSANFIDFIKYLQKDAKEPIYIVADGASYHSSKQTQCYINSTKDQVRLYKLPPYSPELNPDEQVWNHAKRKTGKMTIANKADMKKAAMRVLRSIQKTTNLIKSFFQLEKTKYAAI